MPVNRVLIEKPGSVEMPPLGMATITDLVVHTVVRMVIKPIFKTRFAKHSGGFRPGRATRTDANRA